MKKLLTNLLLAAILLPDFGHAHVALAPEPQQQTSSRKTIISRSLLSNPPIAALSREDCRIDAFAAASEEELIELIDSIRRTCMYQYLFEELSDSLRGQIFTKENMLYVSQVAAQEASDYSNEENTGFVYNNLIHKLFYFLQAGFWNYTEYPSLISSYDQSQVRQAVHTALRAFISNTHFYDIREPLTIAFQEDGVLELSPAFIQCAATSSCPP